LAGTHPSHRARDGVHGLASGSVALQLRCKNSAYVTAPAPDNHIRARLAADSTESVSRLAGAGDAGKIRPTGSRPRAFGSGMGRIRQENCNYGTSNITLRNFAISNIDNVQLYCHYVYFLFFLIFFLCIWGVNCPLHPCAFARRWSAGTRDLQDCVVGARRNTHELGARARRVLDAEPEADAAVRGLRYRQDQVRRLEVRFRQRRRRRRRIPRPRGKPGRRGT
jgi:hypothetical protein